ncbi:hypothetical protein P8452_54799 [Trifolium repens]|nr:hypothetical protein P8452_54799 [Trifolium repens]
MIKIGTIFLIVGILFALFNLNYGSDVVQKDDIKFCRQSMTLNGKCQNSPTCFEVFNVKYGASATTHQCSCQDAGNSHTCSCCINCVFTDGKTPC